MYFSKKDIKYADVRKFNNRVKRQLISRYSNSEYVIDMASGKGQDLQKYVDAKINNLLMLEIDESAIDELIITMKSSILNKLWIERIDYPPNIIYYKPTFQLSIAQMNLTDPSVKNIKQLSEFSQFQKNKIENGNVECRTGCAFISIFIHFFFFHFSPRCGRLNYHTL